MSAYIKKRFKPFVSAFSLSLLFHTFFFIFLVLTPNTKEFFNFYVEEFFNLENISFSKEDRYAFQNKQKLAKKEFSKKTATPTPKSELKTHEPESFNQAFPASSQESSSPPQSNPFVNPSEEKIGLEAQNSEPSNGSQIQSGFAKSPSEEGLSSQTQNLEPSSPIGSKENVSLPKSLVYEIFYGPFKLGETVIQIEGAKYTAVVYTTGLGNTIYPYYAKWETWVDEQGNPWKTIVYSKDREKERKKLIFFEKEKGIVLVKKDLKSDKPGETFNLAYPIYDELSSFIKSWLNDYLSQPRVEFPIYVKEERKLVKVSSYKEIQCAYQNKEKICLELKVRLPETSELLSRNREVRVYLLKDERYPLEIRGKLPLLGSLVGKLKEVVK